jgi:hypothetical protein
LTKHLIFRQYLKQKEKRPASPLALASTEKLLTAYSETQRKAYQPPVPESSGQLAWSLEVLLWLPQFSKKEFHPFHTSK